MKVLIVDDKYENCLLLEALLKGNGYEVQSALNGAEAIEILNSSKVDLIISDILMPVMDGFELCRKSKSNEKFKHIPFIIYTATYTGPEDEVFANKIGADRFIVKPCEPDVFMEIVNEVLSAKQRGELCNEISSVPENEIFKLYNARLVRKLEQKMIQLEKEILIRQDVEKKAKEAAERWKIIFDAMLDPVAFLSIDHIILQCNRSFANFIGQESEKLVGQNCCQLIHGSSYPIKNCPIERSILSGNRETIELCVGEKTVFVLIDPVKDSEGKIYGFVHIIRDVTEHKKMESAQKELQNKFYQAQKMESVGRLAGGVAHDFNNLLSIVLGYGEILLESLDNNHPNYELVEQIYQAGLRARELTKQLLAFSRKQVLEMKIMNINDVIIDFEKLLRRLIGEDIILKLVLTSEKLMVKADPSQIEQVLMNLAVNARDAMPNGGMLMIETKAVELTDIHAEKCQGLPSGNYVMIGISDTGIGMEKDVIERLFEPFFTTKGEEKGTGLGLATSYGIVKQHGGDLTAYSKLGEGTTFTIYLPIYNESQIEKEQPSIPVKIQTPMERSFTVLIIEDDSPSQNLLYKILTEKGHSVILSNGAFEAINKAKDYKGNIHLVLTDVIMPEMKGPEVFEKIQEYHPESKVLYMSGYTDNMIISRGILEEKIIFIQKPFTIQNLLEKCYQAIYGI